MVARKHWLAALLVLVPLVIGGLLTLEDGGLLARSLPTVCAGLHSAADRDDAVLPPAGGRPSDNAVERIARLRRELEHDKRRAAAPYDRRSVSYTHWYWSEIGLGFKKNNFDRPVAKQLRLFMTPPPVSTRVYYHDNESFPLVWREPASRVAAATFNATRAAAQPAHEVMLAADVWFVEGCVRLISTPECEWPLDWTNITLALHGAWNRSACAHGPGGAWACPSNHSALRSDGPLPVSRVQLRQVTEWSVMAEFCSQRLATVEVVDFELHGWGVTRRFNLARVDDAQPPGEEVAMVVVFKGSAFMLPLWLQYWRALGVGRFYLYYNGKLHGLYEEDARIAAQVASDPGVTVIQWDLPFAQVNGIRPITGVCSGHYAQVAAFNHAFHRVRGRHLYMGFFDPDEYGLYAPSVTSAATTTGSNPTLLLLSMYGFPAALALDNRFGAVVPPPPRGAPLPPSDALHATWYARRQLEPARSKAFVRTFRHPREDVHVGVHDLWPFATVEVHRSTGTVTMSGTGFESRGLALATHALPSDATMLHVLNFKGHVSALPFDAAAEIRSMVAAGEALKRPEVAATLRHARAACHACSVDAASPGCGYAC